jgi:hypothetical protein
MGSGVSEEGCQVQRRWQAEPGARRDGLSSSRAALLLEMQQGGRQVQMDASALAAWPSMGHTGMQRSAKALGGWAATGATGGGRRLAVKRGRQADNPQHRGGKGRCTEV